MLTLTVLPATMSLIYATLTVRCVNSAPATVLKTLRPIATLFFNILLFRRGLAPHLVINVLVVVATIALVVVNGSLVGGVDVLLRIGGGWCAFTAWSVR